MSAGYTAQGPCLGQCLSLPALSSRTAATGSAWSGARCGRSRRQCPAPPASSKRKSPVRVRGPGQGVGSDAGQGVGPGRGSDAGQGAGPGSQARAWAGPSVADDCAKSLTFRKRWSLTFTACSSVWFASCACATAKTRSRRVTFTTTTTWHAFVRRHEPASAPSECPSSGSRCWP